MSADSPPSAFRHQLLGIALLLSTVVHLVLLWSDIDTNPAKSFAQPSPTPAPLKISLVNRSDGPELPEEPTLSPIPPIEIAEVKAEASALPSTSPPAMELPKTIVTHPRKKLDLQLRAPSPEPLPPPKHQTRGTVVNPTVAEKLALAQAMPDGGRQLPGYSELDPGQGEYQNGQWATHIRMGERCFRWLRANPLDSFSEDQWFLIDCPRS